jgi:hypothetical protein
MRKWGIGIIAGVLVSCSASKSNSSTKYERNANPFTLTVKTSPCFGRCPFYEMVISSNGKSSFEGFRDPKTDGVIELTLPKAEIDSLTTILANHNFNALDSLYDNPLISDLPSVTLSLENEIGIKTVTGRYDTPESFRRITAFIERLRKRNFSDTL